MEMRCCRLAWARWIGAGYQWTTWFFIASMVLSQFLCIVDNTLVTKAHVSYGRDPRLGTTPIIGSNDAPYTDRSIVCIYGGNRYSPMLVNQAISKGLGRLFDTSGAFRGGYRLIQRNKVSTIDSLAKNIYQSVCSQLESTQHNIFNACTALGYDGLERDKVRVVIDENAYEFSDTIPVLVIPFFDNSQTARYIVAGQNGDACVFRLIGSFADTLVQEAIFRGVNRSIRYERMEEWLGRRNGTWRNRWYIDLTKSKWNGEVTSFSTTDLNITHRQFELRSGKEENCSRSSACNIQLLPSNSWGSAISTQSKHTNLVSIYIANSTQDGLFTYKSIRTRIITAKYTWKTLLSNATSALLLARWMLSMLAIHHGYLRGETKSFNCGISCIGSSVSFKFFLLTVLPHLKTVLCAIWTVGCDFEGQQLGMSDAWFVIYPAIVEFSLMYCSLLNLAARIFRRHMTDALFGPTIISLCAMHYFRTKLAHSGWLKGVEGRVSTLVFSSDVDKLQLGDFFTSDIALQLNGNVRELFIAKLLLIGINLLPLIFAKPIPMNKRQTARLSMIEKGMAISTQNVGGLYSSTSKVDAWCCFMEKQSRVGPIVQLIDGSKSHESKQLSDTPFLPSYELIRLGYVVYGGKFVIEFDDWDIISTFAPLRSFYHFWNYRVTAWTLEPISENRIGGYHRRQIQRLEPEMMRLDDPRLMQGPWWNISACDIE